MYIYVYVCICVSSVYVYVKYVHTYTFLYMFAYTYTLDVIRHRCDREPRGFHALAPSFKEYDAPVLSTQLSIVGPE